MIPNPRRINPSVSPARFARAQRRVMWLMQGGAGAGQADRLGAEPEPETEPEEEEEDQEVAPPSREPTHETMPAPGPSTGMERTEDEVQPPPVTTLPPR